MDLIPTLHEVGRILVSGGILGVLWSGPDPDGPLLVEAQALLTKQMQGGAESGGLASQIMGEARRPMPTLEIPPGVPFDQPEHEVFTWEIALNADELIGLLGTLSWIITMPEEMRNGVITETRRLLRDPLGVEGEATVDIAFRSDAWRTRQRRWP